MKKLFYVIIPLSVFFVSCEHDPVYTPIGDDDPIGGVDPGDSGEECDPDKIYFVNEVMPIISSNCAISGCHGGGSSQDGIELSSYSGIMEIVEAGDAFDSEIYEVITENDSDDRMPPPPNAPLTAGQIAIIMDWINQGATNEECANTECDLSNVTFSQSVWPIIQNNCTGCHSGGSPQGNINLTNYSRIAQVAGSGLLLGVIQHEPGFVPMPYNGQQLDPCKIATIEEWVNQGYPEN